MRIKKANTKRKIYYFSKWARLSIEKRTILWGGLQEKESRRQVEHSKELSEHHDRFDFCWAFTSFPSHQRLNISANHWHLFTTIPRMHQFGFNFAFKSERLSVPIVTLRVLVTASLRHKLEMIWRIPTLSTDARLPMMPQRSGVLENSKFFHQTSFWFFPLRQKLCYLSLHFSRTYYIYLLFHRRNAPHKI